MNRKKDQRQQTHEQILEAARRLFRQDGYKPTRIEQIMDSIGLTVGGFYNHFGSKDELFREVVETTASAAVSAGEKGKSDPAERTRRFAKRYLSTEHRDNPAGGCLLPSLSAEIARADESVRSAYTRFVTRSIDKLAESMAPGDSRSASKRAWAVLALSVGGLLLARAVNDEEISRVILAACREAAEKV
jgi:TetR/AcrR family transcriptional repressor of nem operon